MIRVNHDYDRSEQADLPGRLRPRLDPSSPTTLGKPLVTLSMSGESLPVLLRRERPEDRAAIFSIHAAAFSRPDGLVTPQAHLVDCLRDDGDIVPALSIVAESNNDLVGHVVCSRATITSLPSLGLGLPAWSAVWQLGVRPTRLWCRHGFSRRRAHPGQLVAAAGRLAARDSRLADDLRRPRRVRPRIQASTGHCRRDDGTSLYSGLNTRRVGRGTRGSWARSGRQMVWTRAQDLRFCPLDQGPALTRGVSHQSDREGKACMVMR